ncbi:UbiA prenyltransferase family-domain-containing protein [Clohesyomyces aquaticus]|uniref:UbiA prenyltransferase family-domain-containing protein n=1 Tax=Clohesyomyces aquaticus TaxID=1231657 RepID=A0A1Y2A7S9_9PLEO|nr:UbiA prenyltransferase family-domain-containing protein [Clohesyomyces aquaticus]
MARGLTAQLAKPDPSPNSNTLFGILLEPSQLLKNPAFDGAKVLKKLVENYWFFTQDDIATFAIPNTIFGMCCAYAGQPLVSVKLESIKILLSRTPAVILFNCSNLLIFDLANQRLWESVIEDKLNKPWRPIPSERMTRSEVRRALQLVIPIVLAINHYVLHTGAETACIILGTWVYNDLKASDDSCITRNAIIALAFGVFNWSSLKVAIGGGGSSAAHITSSGYAWIWLFSGVILTTMHVQDMKDQAGDRSRGRKTAPLVIGDWAARWSLAIPIFLWGPVCAASMVDNSCQGHSLV